jgi:hypothetical protein
MISLAIFACFLCLHHLGSCDDSNEFKGKFDTRGGSTCEWKGEEHSKLSHSSVVSLKLECSCSTKDNDIITYSCEYEGDPSKCELFEVPGGKHRFYSLLAFHFQDELHGCISSEVDVAKIAKRVCKNDDPIMMMKKDSGPGRYHDPSHCSQYRERGRKTREL